MNNIEQKADNATTEKYITLISIISRIEDRLRLAELVYLSLNIVVFLFTFSFISSMVHKSGYFLTYMDVAFVLFSLIIGLSINAYWIASAMRLQLKLKLHYFQARGMERKMNRAGENIFSDASIFFDPNIRQVESPDNKEKLLFPTSGITRMDGFIGSAKPRHFSWLMPCLFAVIYWIIFFLVLSLK